uniref:NADH:flavin oxidoreductase/NADH oxidase N-terminal domain-containing protein n=1 Tax=Bionectria ochroleuca TaxID=29856 RepID=A0A8H7N616_BIOOC
MSEHLATFDADVLENRGVPLPELVNVYRRWAYDQLEAAENTIIPPDAPFSGDRFEAFGELASQAKKDGSLIVAQVSHPGRQVPESIQPHPISASDVRLEAEFAGKSYAKPRPMEEADFKSVIDGFAHAAEYLYKAGFDGIQLHGAHGYLISQFLSLSTNKRIDEYGGTSILNRARLITEITHAIRARVPDPAFILSIKVNSVEFQDEGFSPKILSGGTYQSSGFKHVRESSKKREAFFIEFAEAIIPALSRTKAYVTGGLRSAKAMADALKTVDGVGLGRPATHEFDLPAKILAGSASGAIDVLIREDDFGKAVMTAGLQLKLVGNDKQPLDLSHSGHMKVLDDAVANGLLVPYRSVI